MLKRKIGWQKYEDVIEGQINSPLIDMISKSIANNKDLEPFLNSPDMSPTYEEEEEDQEELSHKVIVSVPEEITNEIHLMANFDCWVGHANFNLTDEIKKQLSRQDGVEILKVCSRYRFFVGVGRMFNFRDVRQGIEKTLLGKNTNERQDN
tara:strand:+ start:178 stop:630 length:453 start_codon:yes stop_codon:yes gene_type:complete